MYSISNLPTFAQLKKEVFMKKNLYLLVIIMLSGITFISCQKESTIENEENNFTITNENIGYIHNECLKAAYEAIKESPIFDQSSRSLSKVITIQDVTDVIGKADVACFKRLGEIKKLSDTELRNFVNQNLNTQIPEGVYKAMSNMIYNPSFSYTKDYLTPQYGSNISDLQKEFLEDFISQLRNTSSNASLDYVADKMKVKWYPLAKTQEDRSVIASTCNVAQASTDYWTHNISKWKISKIEKSSFRTVCGALVGADCACITELMWMSAIGVLVADKIALVCVGTSLSAGIGQAVNDLIVNWPSRNAIDNTISYQEYQKLILSSRLKAIKADSSLN